MIVEIPRWSNAKQEVSKDLDYNPIKQDIKKGKLRFVRNCFPHHGYPFTYGAIPQVPPLPSFSPFRPSCPLFGSRVTIFGVVSGSGLIVVRHGKIPMLLILRRRRKATTILLTFVKLARK